MLPPLPRQNKTHSTLNETNALIPFPVHVSSPTISLPLPRCVPFPVSIRNTKNILFKNLMDVSFSTLTFYLFGYAFLYGGGNSFIGASEFALQSHKFSEKDGSLESVDAQAHEYAKFVYAFAFAATATTIVSGAVAERFKFRSYALYGSMITTLLYPVVAHWVWCSEGWASAFAPKSDLLFGSGAVDYAGSGVVHVTGGLAALIACVAVGPRLGRFNGNLLTEMPQQSPVFQTIGTIILWFGWYGFNCVAAQQISGGKSILAARSAVTTTISAALGGATTIFIDHVSPRQKLEPRRMNNGILCGLVSISGSAGLIEPHYAIVVGVVSAMCYTTSSKLLLAFRVDDVVDAVPIHLAGGVWGLICPALFVSRQSYMLMYGYPSDDVENAPCGLFMGCKNHCGILGANVLLLLALVIWIGATCTGILFVLKRIIGVRVNVQEEMKGIDASQHGGRSYTEFQTTVFKFKSANGTEHSMEMRVRAGDAAKFAMALSEVMDGSTRSSDNGSGSDSLTRGQSAHFSRSMVFINNQPASGGESEGGDGSPGGTLGGAGALGEAAHTHVAYDGHHDAGVTKPVVGHHVGGAGGREHAVVAMPPSGLAGLMPVMEETFERGGSRSGSMGGGGRGGRSGNGRATAGANGGGRAGVPLDPFADAAASYHGSTNKV